MNVLIGWNDPEIKKTKGGGFKKYSCPCLQCKRLSTVSYGNFKDGATRKIKYGCQHFQDILIKAVTESELNPLERFKKMRERAFLFPHKVGEKTKKLFFVFQIHQGEHE